MAPFRSPRTVAEQCAAALACADFAETALLLACELLQLQLLERFHGEQ
jgi:hypothetical protein